MFIKELQLNVEYLREQLADLKGSDTRQIKDALDFGKQLLCGIEYYRTILHQLPDPDRFANQLTECETEIKKIALQLSERQKGAQLN
jgi:hypothetical protein